jgi:hypothetical protein
VNVGNWSGGAFTNDQTGAFTGCIASASYKSGITVFVMVGANVTWNLGFTNSNWSLKPGATFPIVLTFDGRSPINVNGRVISAQTVSVDMPDASDLIKQFRASTTMSAFAEQPVPVQPRQDRNTPSGAGQLCSDRQTRRHSRRQGFCFASARAGRDSTRYALAGGRQQPDAPRGTVHRRTSTRGDGVRVEFYPQGRAE